MFKKPGRNDLCWCGSEKKYKNCHSQFDERLCALQDAGYTIPPHKIIKSVPSLDGIRTSGVLSIKILDEVAKFIKPGVSTQDIDTLVYERTTARGGICAPLNYDGFPKSVCVSINDQVCHGIPSETVFLKEGDIVNVDVSTLYNGFFSDCSRMFCIGSVSSEKERLVRIAKEAIEVGLSQVKPWNPLGDVGGAIHDFARENGYTVVKEIGGHGIGLEFHEEPFVSYVVKKGTGMIMVPGMVFTIEPMINMGKSDIYMDDSNNWTVYTDDGMPSAQWEVTVAVTEDGYEILAH